MSWGVLLGLREVASALNASTFVTRVMKATKKTKRTFEDKVADLFEFVVEGIGWIQIMISPFLIGIILGVVIYFAVPSTEGMILGMCVAGIGLLVGVIWATNKWKGKGTVEFMSRLIAKPELDDLEDDESEERRGELEEGS